MSPTLFQRLRQGETIILDGAIGTELQRRGAPMDSAAWCAVATKTHPHLLGQLHLDYIAAGADIITTNTFSTARHVLEAAGLADDTGDINRSAVRLAREAVERSGRSEVIVAGSMSSMGALNSPPSRPSGASIAASYQEQADILADAGVDLFIAEMMCDLTNSTLVIEAARATGLPLLVGWTASPDGKGGVAPYRSQRQQQDIGYSFDELMELGAALGGDAAGIMHSDVEVTGPALEQLARHWDGPLMAYAETGRFESPNWVFEEIASPAEYAGRATQWAAAAAGIVGGCCGTTPEHIAVLSDTLSDRGRKV